MSKKKSYKKLLKPEAGLFDRRYWLFAVGLALLLVLIQGHAITRPINGLHSWGEAHGAWCARVHVTYGLGYTGGFTTWAVGDPPQQPPRRYLDHPQLGVLTTTAFMAVFGVNDWSTRIGRIFFSVATLLILLMILRGLKSLDAKTSLLAGLFAVLFPISGYFGVGSFESPLGLFGVWCYLVIIGRMQNTERRWWHLPALGMSLFLSIQMSWGGFFYALAIGVHYVARCVWRRSWPQWWLLAVLVVAPLASVGTVMAALAMARGGDIGALLEIYKWRTTAQATSSQGVSFDWVAWFGRLGVLSVLNFTWIALALGLGHCVYHCVAWVRQLVLRKTADKGATFPRANPLFWLLLLTPLAQLFLLKGAMWHHHYWLRPITPLLSVAAACAVMGLWDLLRKLNVALAGAMVGLTLVLFALQAAKGTKYYYDIVQHPLPKIQMLQRLRDAIPPDKALLSFQSFVVQDNPAKGSHYRPQIAWYLDRRIVPSNSLQDILAKAATGRFPRYLVPAVQQLAPLINELARQYPIVEQVPGVARVDGIPLDPSMPMNRGSLPYLVFDLTRPKR